MPKKIQKAPIGHVIIEKNTGYLREKTEDGWRRQHCVIIERNTGRKMKKNEQVHHKNGIKDDNRIENLELIDNSDHQKLEYKKGTLGICKHLKKMRVERKKFSDENIKYCQNCGKKMVFESKKYIKWDKKLFLNLKTCGCKKKKTKNY